MMKNHSMLWPSACIRDQTCTTVGLPSMGLRCSATPSCCSGEFLILVIPLNCEIKHRKKDFFQIVLALLEYSPMNCLPMRFCVVD